MIVAVTVVVAVIDVTNRLRVTKHVKATEAMVVLEGQRSAVASTVDPCGPHINVVVELIHKHNAYIVTAVILGGERLAIVQFLSRAVEETVRGFKAILDGEMDEYPEAAFFNVGTIDDVKKKAEEMTASEM